MKLLKELRKKYQIEKITMMRIFGYSTPQAYDNLQNKAKYFSIDQILNLHDLFKEKTGKSSDDFIATLRKE